MSRHLVRSVYLVLGGALLAGLGGCSQQPKMSPIEPPTVTVATPLSQEIVDYVYFTGRTEAVESVELRARVSGYLVKINFADGAMVKKDQVLFEIDPRTYQAQLDQAKARVDVAKAQINFAEAEYKRNKVLRTTGSVSQEDLEKSQRSLEVAQADLVAGQAEVARLQLDLDFTKVIAPISGQASRTQITVGNLVEPGKTLLTTIVSLDPIYAYFDVDELTALNLQAKRRGNGTPRDEKPEVMLEVANETGYPHVGKIDFVDNQVNAATGTIRVRGVFPNKDQVLSPGLFVRVRVPTSKLHPALLITDRAVGTDQGQKFVYVLNEKNEVVYRPVTLGAVQNGLRVVESGLNARERLIINGLQRVRPGLEVKPIEGTIQSSAPAPQPNNGKKPANGTN